LARRSRFEFPEIHKVNRGAKRTPEIIHYGGRKQRQESRSLTDIHEERGWVPDDSVKAEAKRAALAGARRMGTR
jgi:hypothetical protein